MRQSKPWLTALLQLVILIAVVAGAAPWLDAKEAPLPIPRRSGDVTLRGQQARPVFNGSVVPGGVYSLEELRAAIQRDPIVAAHYRAMHVDEMQLVTLTAGKAAYVSYRIGDRVYWTRGRVYLKAGETVMTDGHTTIRARCGNCVSDAKQQAVSGVEPAPGELDDFVVPPTPQTGVDAFAAAAEEGLGDLLDVPFGPQMFASAIPGGGAQPPVDDSFGDGGFPIFTPPLLLPGGGGTVGGSGGTPRFVPPGGVAGGIGGDDGTTTGGTTGSGTTGTTSGSPGDMTGGTSETGSPTGSATGSPTDTLTTGLTGDTTSNPSTGTATGDLTTGGTSTNGVVTDGTVSPTTTTAESTSSSGATPAPEPDLLWLVAGGLIGVARQRLRGRQPRTKD